LLHLSVQAMRKTSVIVLAGLLVVGSAIAHHSFAPYDIRRTIEFSGEVENWRFMRPHPILELKEAGEDGRTWTIEVATRRWERQEIPHDAIANGDTLDVVVWPARDGSAKGVLSAFTNDGVFTLIQTEIRQRSAVQAAEAAEASEAAE
jgi:hypothetical protein